MRTVAIFKCRFARVRASWLAAGRWTWLTAAAVFCGAACEAQAGVIYAVDFTAAMAQTSDSLITIPASSFDLAFSFDAANIDLNDHVAGSAFTGLSLSSTDFSAADFNAATSLLDLNGVSLPASGASPIAISPGGNTEIHFSNSAGALSRTLKISADAVLATYSEFTEFGPHALSASTNQVGWTLGAPDVTATPEPTSLAIWSAFAVAGWSISRRKGLHVDGRRLG